MEDIIFKISYSLLIVGAIYALYIRPRYWFRKQINQEFIKELGSKLNLIQTDGLYFENEKSNFYTEVTFIKPSNQLPYKITMRIMLNFKPLDDFKKQKEKVEELNEQGNYHWVANGISKDINFLTQRPQIGEIKNEIDKMITVIKNQGFEGINKTDSNSYGDYWDKEIEK